MAITPAQKEPTALAEIDRLAAAGAYERALTLSQSALLSAPGHPGIALRRIRLLTRLERLGEAAQLGRQLCRWTPDSELAWDAFADALLEAGEVAEAFEAYRKATSLRRRIGGPGRPQADLGSSPSKLRHDLEQLQWLAAQGELPPERRKLIDSYTSVLNALKARGATGAGAFTERERALIGAVYNRLVVWDAGASLDGPAVNPALDRSAIQTAYACQAPGMVAVDSLLTEPALTALRRFCLASTIWFEYRYRNGYLGAFMQDGFACPLLLQIAEELAAALPDIFRHHKLRKTWAFKCDSRQDALPVHADFAAVNVNFWLTPDSANLDPEGGGLIVWDRKAPRDWDFRRYNSDTETIQSFLDETGATPITYAYRQNRALIFNSDLFHRSGPLHFREGYENRRVNVTMLFGKREGAA